MTEQEFIDKYTIFRCRAGSHAYGTNIASSDIDVRGVFIAPPSHIISCTQFVEQVEVSGEDTTIFELQKFLKLAADCNPNIIELLFTDEENIIEMHPAWEKIRAQRGLFLSKKARHSFSGYAISQLKRIKGHHRWITNPQPKEEPRLINYCKIVNRDGAIITDPLVIEARSRTSFIVETFGRSQFRIFRSPEFFPDKLGFFSEDGNQVRPVNVADDKLIGRAEYYGFLIVNFDEYKKNHRDWKDYWKWKNNRNETRAKLEEQHGFDTKHASHLVRLMRMCKEIITEGRVVVRRPDAAELLEIRSGKFDYEGLIKWSEEMDAELDDLYEHSTLRYSADKQSIDELYREVVLEFWREKGLL